LLRRISHLAAHKLCCSARRVSRSVPEPRVLTFLVLLDGKVVYGYAKYPNWDQKLLVSAGKLAHPEVINRECKCANETRVVAQYSAGKLKVIEDGSLRHKPFKKFELPVSWLKDSLRSRRQSRDSVVSSRQ
jgi:hypothetical protein